MALPLSKRQRLILRLLRETGGLTLPEIANRLGLGISDTASSMTRLIREDYVTIRNLYEARDIAPGEREQ